jgi:hypothetical protein
VDLPAPEGPENTTGLRSDIFAKKLE